MIPSDVNVGLREYEGKTELEAALSFKTRFFQYHVGPSFQAYYVESAVLICFFQFFMPLCWSSEPELLVNSFSSVKLVTSQIS